MTWVFILLAAALVVALALALSGRLPAIPQPGTGPVVTQLPPDPSPEQIDELRFPVVLRGYRMQDVDMAISVLSDRIAQLESASSVPQPESATDRPGVTDE